MKKFLFVTALSFCTYMAFSQAKKSPVTTTTPAAATPAVPLLDLPEVAKWEQYNYTNIQYAKEINDPKSTRNIGNIIEKLNNNVGADSILIPGREGVYINKYKADIISALKNLENNGKYVDKLYYGKFSPVRFCTANDVVTFFLGGLYYPEVVTATKTNANDRIREVFSKFAAPNISLLTDVVKNPEIKQVALAVSYPIKDVDAKSSYFKYETLVVVVSKPVLQAFAKAAITEKELMTKASIYAHTTEMARLQTQKVDLVN